MSEQFRLGLNETVVVSILKQVSNRFTSYNGVKVVADFNDRVLFGKGKTGFISSKGVCLTIGIAGLSKVSEPRCRFSVFKFGESGEPRVVDDLSFVACLVTLGHDFEIVAEAEEVSDDPRLTKLDIVDENGESMMRGEAAVFSLDPETGMFVTNVVNYTGAKLPSTGGVGVYGMYMAGAVIVAVGVLITRTGKKKEYA